MTRLFVALAIAAFTGLDAHPQSPGRDLEAFIRLRQQHGIKGPASSDAVEKLKGPTIIEVRGVARGKVQIDGRLKALFEGTGGPWIATSIPDNLSHLTRRDTKGRFIVRMRRTAGGLEAEILAGVHEWEISKWEEENPAAPDVVAPPLWNPLDSLKPSNSNPGSDAVVHYYSDFILRQNVALSVDTANAVARQIIESSKRAGIDARLITAVIWSRSNFTPNFVSAGRFGLGGLSREECDRYGAANPFEIAKNVDATCKLLRASLEAFAETKTDGTRRPNIALALAAFDAGTAAVRRYRGVPPYKSTQEFVETVSERYKKLTGQK